MDPAISFQGSNFGLQVANTYGPINPEFKFHLVCSSSLGLVSVDYTDTGKDLDNKLSILYDAVYSSYVGQHDECLPGTRTGILILCESHIKLHRQVISEHQEWPYLKKPKGSVFRKNGVKGSVYNITQIH